jgi:hypothetical protein
MQGGNELNAPNTIDGCIDGDSGLYLQDESLDKIIVRSGTINGTGGGDLLQAGKVATIIASVSAYSDGSQDYADFFFLSEPSSDIYNATWTFIGTVQPSQPGQQDLILEYTLPFCDIQAVRVNYRHMGNAGSCTNGQMMIVMTLYLPCCRALLQQNHTLLSQRKISAFFGRHVLV